MPFEKRGIWLSLFLISAASLAFEINLTRLFSVAQFYHFAFMIVSIALLGYGASGATLAIFPALLQGHPSQHLSRLAWLTSLSILSSYLIINWLPFDSYSIAIDRRQILILVLHYIALSMPFFFSGMALGIMLTDFPGQAGPIYAVNLVGSASGCILAMVAPGILGGEGMVTLCSLLAVVASLIAAFCARPQPRKIMFFAGLIILIIFNLVDLSLRIARQSGLQMLELHISPYKNLSYAMQYPGSKITYRQWNAFSRIDVVASSGIHSLPGLSYRYLEPLPRFDSLYVDGDDPTPIVPNHADTPFTAYLPNAIAFFLRPQANTLVLEPRGGIEALTALSLSRGKVTCVEINPLIVTAAPIYTDQRLSVHQESERSYLQGTHERYDVIVLSLISTFHPVQSGAFSLAEDYRYTLEGFQEMLGHLPSGGLLVATRWLQDPPSEDLRLFALAITALESRGADPRQQIVAFRGYNTSTILVKNSRFSPQELDDIHEFTSERAFDLTYAPGIHAEETNQYNILPESTYYHTYLELLDSVPRQAFFDTYEYDVSPPTDDHPFFGHYFKWSQTPQILAVLGKAWLPFGGGGYFVVLVLFALAVVLAGTLILLPVGIWKLTRHTSAQADYPFNLSKLIYFGLLGFAFLLVEIPLLQRFILYLGNPAYAVTTVLFALLFFSGLGSHWSKRINPRICLGLLSVVILFMPLILSNLFAWTLGLTLAARLSVTVLVLAPIGFMMGIPFPSGLHFLSGRRAGGTALHAVAALHAEIPWIWAVNGAASVVSPILAAILALTFGFRLVLWVGAFCYLAALFTGWASLRPETDRRPGR